MYLQSNGHPLEVLLLSNHFPGMVKEVETDFALGLAAEGKAVNLDGMSKEDMEDLDSLE